MLRQRLRRRRGASVLDLVICTAVLVPIAFALFVIAVWGMDHFFFLLGNVVGWPLM